MSETMTSMLRWSEVLLSERTALNYLLPPQPTHTWPAEIKSVWTPLLTKSTSPNLTGVRPLGSTAGISDPPTVLSSPWGKQRNIPQLALRRKEVLLLDFQHSKTGVETKFLTCHFMSRFQMLHESSLRVVRVVNRLHPQAMPEKSTKFFFSFIGD